MNITIYLSKRAFLPAGGYVLVPDCFLPSVECRRMYGPLLACGKIQRSDDHLDGPWRQIIADFDDQTYAVIDSAAVEALFGVQIARPATSAFGRETGCIPARYPERSTARRAYLSQHA